MKTNLLFYLIFFLLVCFTTMVKAQVATNTVDYKITYDPATQVYSVFVVPNYSTPNTNNLDAIERGATAQVSLKVPNGFVIANITDVNGIWDKAPLKLGPNQQAQYTGQGLPTDKAYYVIGKGASETNYGQFISGTDVPLFTFTGNGCFGSVEIIQKTDPFVTISDNVLSFNTAPSFYSRSGQPAGGNQQPLEQYNAPAGAPAN